MKRFLLFWSLVLTAIALPNAFAHQSAGIQGFVVDAEYRFRPEVQRLMAERSLRALPLQDGKLYYVYPMNTGNTAYLEAMQIQNLERLLAKDASKQPPQEEVSQPAAK